MRALMILIALPLALAACRQPQAPVKQTSAQGVELGTLFDGTKLIVGEGELAGKPIVINFFGVG